MLRSTLKMIMSVLMPMLPAAQTCFLQLTSRPSPSYRSCVSLWQVPYLCVVLGQVIEIPDKGSIVSKRDFELRHWQFFSHIKDIPPRLNLVGRVFDRFDKDAAEFLAPMVETVLVGI